MPKLQKYVWSKDGFTLTLEWQNKFRDGRQWASYELKDGDTVLFSGNDLAPAPGFELSHRVVVSDVIGFLTLKKGDTDPEFFDNYTPDQMEWTRSDRCEELQMLGLDIEEGK